MNKVKKFVKNHKEDIAIAGCIIAYGLGCYALGIYVDRLAIGYGLYEMGNTGRIVESEINGAKYVVSVAKHT